MMNTEVWKEFEQNEITHSAAHHIMAIDGLLQRNGYARVTDVARALSITRGSASITLKALKERGLVEEDENKFLHLTRVGSTIAQEIHSKRMVLIKFLSDVLHVPPEQAMIDSCKVEHLISAETGGHLLTFLKFLFSGDQVANKFLRVYHDFKESACGEVTECPICEHECLREEGFR